ncbi:hypothetical protein TUM19329_11500 [Legionella antarctica]|uniref:Uncharacterized protein n=1 Tax=Legionella antarctica TaxID=2708020 RepID=A0A6F8T2X9_9GAMM|nr:hypothetical protein [Legionella antarctica]BCA94789.1 hypothetical protein TUM19329_11500 [Legionella antarctica]
MTDFFKGGLDLKFVANSEFESLDLVAPANHAPIIARNALRLLMMGWPAESWTQLLSWPVFKAVFVCRSPELLKELRFAFQQGFELLFTQLEGKKLTTEQNEQVQLYLSNCLGLLPYSDLTPYESIKIPQNINDEWVLVEYHITPIELTPTTGFKSFFIQDTDRVFAYGLQPIKNHKAPSQLIFMGTTYPAGQGFLPQIKTDLKGFETVGKSLYKSGIGRIKQWLSRQDDNVHVCGVSLGGSLSLLLAIHQGKHLKRVDALNPAGLHDSWRKSKYDKWDQLETKPEVVVQVQADDPVSLLGVWKKDWKIVRVTPPEGKKGPNSFCDHFLNYAGFAQTEFSYVDAEKENTQRRIRNFWLYSVGRSIIYYSTIIPYNYLIRPVFYFILRHWIAFTLGLVSLTGIGLMIGLTGLGVLPLLVLVGAVSALAVVVCVSVLNHFFSSSSAENGDYQFAKLHDPALSRNPSMDIYNPDNQIEVKLTYKELNTYYNVTRCLVKQKNFLPEEKPQAESVDEISKRELLLASQQPENNDKVICMTTVKAKAVHIRQVLTLVNQIGMDNESELKEALEQDYKLYNVGKHP